jgi:hypothetical protein
VVFCGASKQHKERKTQKSNPLWEIPGQDRIYLSTARDYKLSHNAIDTGIQLENNGVLAHNLKIHCMIYSNSPLPNDSIIT